MAIAYNRYFSSNIPIEYWTIDMKDFKGVDELKKAYNNTIEHMQKVYQMGFSMCFAGAHGCGKTTIATNILKLAAQRNYSCLYSTLTDIVGALIDAGYEERFLAKRELITVDFLTIDEMDSRFMLSESSSDLFGKMLEHIVRTRMQNKLPTIFCTNSPNPIEAFTGTIKQSIDSLMSKVKFISVIDKDHRKVSNGN
jgi:DNA replication protein DnaC